MEYLIEISDIIENNLSFGGKANQLAYLTDLGFNVPAFAVLPANCCAPFFKKDKILNPDKLEQTLKACYSEALNLLGAKTDLVVRSSASLEDGTHHSFAGQFESVLNIQNEAAFIEAFKTCYLSKYQSTVQHYCSNNNINIDEIYVHIIIQKYMPAEYAGVCFSVNPLNGKDTELVVEGVRGHNEELVQGQISPSTYFFDWYQAVLTNQYIENNHIIPDQVLQNVYDVALKIQQVFGTPQDIEWVYYNKDLHIVQTRPLTAIHMDVKDDWTNANLKDGGISSEITTPMMYSLYEDAFESTLSNYLKSVHLSPSKEPEKWFNEFMLYGYWNLGASKEGVKKIPGFIERDFDQDLGVEINYDGKGHVTNWTLKSIFNGLLIVSKLNKSIQGTINNSSKELQHFKDIINKYKHLNISKQPINKASKIFDQLFLMDHKRLEGSYFKVIYNNSNNSSLFKSALDKKRDKYQLNPLKLMAGIEDVSHLKPIHEIWHLTQKIALQPALKSYFLSASEDQLVQAYFKNNLPDFQKDITAIIEKYDYHSEKELDIMYPNWNEKPHQVFTSIKHFLIDNTDFPAMQKKQVEIFNQEFKKVKQKHFKRKIQKYRKLLWLREEYRDHSSQLYAILRNMLLQIGTLLVEKKWISDKNDVFFLKKQELSSFLQTSAVSKYQNIIRKNRIRFNSFKNYKKPNEIWTQRTTTHALKNTASEHTFTGIPCSTGNVKLRVYVVHHIEHADTIPEDCILVTPFTNPAWTVYFSRIKGLITETGGMLSHGAIISREFGIPAVLGVQNISTLLKTGDLVELDGDSGTVHILHQCSL